MEPVQNPGAYDFSYIYQDPVANLRVITFGEGFASDFEAMVSTSDYARIAALQNLLKERWVSCSSTCVTCDAVTWVGFTTVLNDFGKIIKSCNGAYGHSMIDHYLYGLFVKNEVDRLNIHCVRAEDNNGGQIFRYENCGLFGCRRCGNDAACTSIWDTTLSNVCPDPALPPLEPLPSYVPPPIVTSPTPQPSVVNSTPNPQITSPPTTPMPSKTATSGTENTVSAASKFTTFSMLSAAALAMLLL